MLVCLGCPFRTGEEPVKPGDTQNPLYTLGLCGLSRPSNQNNLKMAAKRPPNPFRSRFRGQSDVDSSDAGPKTLSMQAPTFSMYSTVYTRTYLDNYESEAQQNSAPHVGNAKPNLHLRRAPVYSELARHIHVGQVLLELYVNSQSDNGRFPRTPLGTSTEHAAHPLLLACDGGDRKSTINPPTPAKRGRCIFHQSVCLE